MKSSFKKVLGSLTAFALAVVTTVPVSAAGPSISGFIDLGYNYNLEGYQTNTGRAFDANANSFTLQNAELVFEGKGKKDIGYRIDLDYGYDASVIQSFGFDAAGDATGLRSQFDIEQAFLTMPCPVTDGTVTMGKFVTPFGAEVIEAKDNFNISRGALFFFAIPFTHTGVKYDKAIGDLSFTAGLVNGWDQMKDANTSKTAIAQAALALSPELKTILGVSYGPEQVQVPAIGGNVNQNGRSLVDAVVIFNPSKELSIVGNYDWGVEEGLPDSSGGTMNWMGLALLAKYQLNATWAGAFRYENFDDEGSRTTAEQVIHTGTVTLEHKKDDFITRLELRQDKSTQKVFASPDGSGSPEDTQTTLGLQWIYTF